MHLILTYIQTQKNRILQENYQIKSLLTGCLLSDDVGLAILGKTKKCSITIQMRFFRRNFEFICVERQLLFYGLGKEDLGSSQETNGYSYMIIIQMVDSISFRLFFIYLFVLFSLMAGVRSQATLNVSVSTTHINSLATYTLTITFTNSLNRTLINLNFPPQIGLVTGTTTVQLGGILLNSSQYTINSGNSSIVINKTINSSSTVVVSNAKNPSSTITTYSFTMSTNNTNDTTTPNIFNNINYTPGTLLSCLYSFTGTTEQTNCTLSATITIEDPIASGNSQIVISYPNKWDNSNSKSMTSGGVSLSCSYSLNGSTVYTTLSCSYDSTNIYANISRTQKITENSVITILVVGVNCPPTVQTTKTNSFKITTYDYLSYVIDSYSGCNISDTTISTTNGAFTNTAQAINSVYSTPQINFSNSVPVTFQVNDTLQAYYQPTAQGCSTSLFLNRSTPISWTNSNNANSIRYYNYSSNNDNSFTTVNMQLFMDCSLTMPPSAQPSTFIFLFKRGSTYYLNLTATLTAQAIPFTNPSKFVVTLQTVDAATISTYTFTVTVSQPLSSQGSLVLILPSVINSTGFTGCTATLNLSTLNLSSCAFSGSNLIAKFNASTSISIGSQIKLIAKGLINPSYAFTLFPFGINTYYNSSLSSSLVEYNSSITTYFFTTYNTNNLFLSPSTFSVYSTVSANITFKNTLYLYSGTIITLALPSAITSLNFSGLVYVNNTLTIINQSSITTSLPLTLTLVYYYDLPIGTNLTIPISIRTPSNLGIYGPINFTATKNLNVYEQQSTLKLSVTQTSPITVKISASAQSTNGQKAGAPTNLTFSITSYMPHSTPYFYFIIIPPNDTSFAANFICSSGCLNYSTMIGGSINVTMNNSYNFTNGFYNYTINIGVFTNPRQVGISGTWYFQTYNKDGSQVGSGSNTFLVALPNVMKGNLSLNYRYYLNNTNQVQLYVTLFNSLISGDYLVLQFGTDTYTSPSGVSCPLSGCSVSNQSTSNILIVTYTPNANQLNVKALTLVISGLMSSGSTIYNQIKYFNISSYTSGNMLIDEGSVSYNVSCGTFPSYSCQTCNSSGSCLTCYTILGMNMKDGQCVYNCTSSTQFQRFNQSGVCVSCTNNCATCYNQTSCRTCETNYFFYQNYSCLPTCLTSSGYYQTTTSGITYCLACYDFTNCLQCNSSSPNGCTKCGIGALDAGVCKSSCGDPNSYLSPTNVCKTCDVSCNGCTGGTNANCLTCNFAYFNYSNYCVTTCPSGTAPIPSQQLCSCEGSCITCSGSSTYCLSCYNSSLNRIQFAYQGQCIFSCPLYSYQSGSACLSCTFGCYNCSATTCFSCDAEKYSFQNNCYQDCNQISMQYDGSTSGSTKICVLCPDGCDTCDTHLCTSCLANYSLLNQTCIQQCLVLGNCASPIPSKVLPLPGLIVVGVWTILIIALKLLLKRPYIPYSLLMCYCLAQLVLIFAGIVVLNSSPSSSNSSTVSRLLLGMDYSYRIIAKNLLITGLALNYLMNVLYIIIFCKYIYPLIRNPHQIDYIVTTVILIISTITNYRFGLMTYSRVFPKPQIHIDNMSRLTPINYLIIASIILDILPLVSSIYLIYKEQILTDLFMIGVDLLIILTLNLMVSIWVVAVPKSEDYYDNDIKKHNIQDNYRTEEDMNNQKNISYNKLYESHPNIQKIEGSQFINLASQPLDNKTIMLMATNQNDFNVQSQQENLPLPAIQRSTTRKIQRDTLQFHTMKTDNCQEVEQINFENDSIDTHSKLHQTKNDILQHKKTKRVINNDLNKAKEKEDDNIAKKIIQHPVNFSKQKIKKMSPLKYSQSAIVNKPFVQNINTNRTQSLEDTQILPVFIRSNKVAAEESLPKANANTIDQRSKKQKRSKTKQIKIKKTEKKIDLLGDSSDLSQKPSEETNLNAIIESKIKNSKFIERKVGKQMSSKVESQEDVSPSWFNQQNQRIDISKGDTK